MLSEILTVVLRGFQPGFPCNLILSIYGSYMFRFSDSGPVLIGVLATVALACAMVRAMTARALCGVPGNAVQGQLEPAVAMFKVLGPATELWMHRESVSPDPTRHRTMETARDDRQVSATSYNLALSFQVPSDLLQSIVAENHCKPIDGRRE